MKRWCIAAGCILAMVSGASGQIFSPFGTTQADFSVKDYLQVRAIPSHLTVIGGQEFHIALEVRIAPEWVYYSPDPGPIVLPGKLSVTAGQLKVGETLWPKDESKAITIGDETIVNNVYTDLAIIYVPVRVPPDITSGQQEIVVELGGQICKDVCMDIKGVIARVSVQIGPTDRINPEWTDEISAGLSEAMTAEQLTEYHAEIALPQSPTTGQTAIRTYRSERTVWWWIGLALLAGVTLNIMPCVLPVIPLRILSIVSMANESRRRFITLGLAFAAGIMLFFVGVAAVSAILRLAADQTINISDHFQYPAVRIALAMVLVALAVNLFGAFNILVPSKVAALEPGALREGHLKSLGMGFMMAVLATPCSFAFLFAAMAWAQIQPLWLGTVAILLIGAGMAAPHALLAGFPGLVGKLPKPGRWMELFKHSMGFALILVTIWLISTLGQNTRAFWVLAWAVVLGFSLWMWGSWVRYDAALLRRWSVRCLAVLLAVGSGFWMLPARAASTSGVEFEAFNEDRISEARNAGQILLVKVTASWCLECKVVNARIYKAPEVADELRTRGIIAMKADVTDRNRPASKWLRRNIGGAPPQTLIFPPDGRGVIQIVGSFSRDALTAALNDAREPQSPQSP